MPWIASQVVDLQVNCSTHEVQRQKNSCHRQCCGSVVGSMSCRWQNEDFGDHDNEMIMLDHEVMMAESSTVLEHKQRSCMVQNWKCIRLALASEWRRLVLSVTGTHSSWRYCGAVRWRHLKMTWLPGYYYSKSQKKNTPNLGICSIVKQGPMLILACKLSTL